jgi:hypothetical protein
VRHRRSQTQYLVRTRINTTRIPNVSFLYMSRHSRTVLVGRFLSYNFSRKSNQPNAVTVPSHHKLYNNSRDNYLSEISSINYPLFRNAITVSKPPKSFHTFSLFTRPNPNCNHSP